MTRPFADEQVRSPFRDRTFLQQLTVFITAVTTSVLFPPVGLVLILVASLISFGLIVRQW